MMKKLMLIVVLAMSSMAFGVSVINPYIDAPEIAPITLDGNLSDWAASSGWFYFADWVQPGRSTVERAQFAWNNASDTLYVGIEVTGPANDIWLEVNSQGDISSPDIANVGGGGVRAVQLAIPVLGGPIASDSGGSTGNAAYSHSEVSGITTIEYSQSFYTDWRTAADMITLSPAQKIYMSIQMAQGGWQGGADSLSDDDDPLIAGQTYFYGNDPAVNSPMVVGSEITLVPEPATMLLLGLGGLLIRRKK